MFVVAKRAQQISQRLISTISRRSLSRNNPHRSPNYALKSKYAVPYYLHNNRRFAVTTINVPNMGDSITEGTLVEWTKNIGDACQVDEIVAVIETDKVSIDIRTETAGVLTEQLSNIDDTLEVNAPLFKIDTD
eukprot:330345_1